MASIIFYTSHAKGHLFPILGAALDLHKRGHQVHIRTLASEMELVHSLGLHAEPIAPEIEARELDDWMKPAGPWPWLPVPRNARAIVP